MKKEVLTAQLLITQHGKRLASSTKSLKTDELVFEGLPFFHYNRKVSDIDSTALVAMVASLFAEQELLPKMTPRSKPGGYTLVKGLRIQPILAEALTAVWDQVDRKVTQMGPVNGITVNKSYDSFALPDVPWKGDHVDLGTTETLFSNANGFAAATWLACSTSGRLRDRRVVSKNLKHG